MLDINFKIFPVLETGRLVLRKADLNDANEMYAMRSDAKVMQYIPRPLSTDVSEAVDYINSLEERMVAKECINWAITLKENGEMIGTIGFYRMKLEHYRAEAGYMLLPTYHGKGYVAEALNRIVKFGFSEMGLHSIEALIDPDNIGSMKVLEKCGFVKEAHFKENEFYDGKFLDTLVYSRLEK
ncbi:GNAT family N-acetyltransferase [Myroides sp. M-43]|uniref:GNAT family N-acetyltransferase n=1 Tax=Myroides oncorhynchi TaxID=2893756 RepID=UPI001E4125A9|nr:GNAT family N-acetyltransferase [Myroides oncorhynchi]MCC9043322.1 GNAT family N-acetyltransferase [Myroides oncorhynchi]